jgi:hypothetical protein
MMDYDNGGQMTDAELDQWVSDSLSHLDSTCPDLPWEDAAAEEDTTP